MNLHTTSGRIESLRIISDKRNVLFGPQAHEVAGLSAVVFAAAGMGSAAVQTSMNRDAADDVALYSFDMRGVRYTGCTREAAFNEGDEVDIVFEAAPSGNQVLAVRRQGSRSIWLHPYMSRGTWAAAMHGLFVWLVASLFGIAVLLPMLALIELSSERWFDLSLFTFGASILAAASFGSLGLVGLFLAPRFMRFASAATEVFAALGYRDPQRVDLHKTTKAYRKLHKLPHCDVELRY